MSWTGTVRDFLLRTTRHPLGFIGVNLTTLSAALLLVLLLASLLGIEPNPYIGIVTFLILPALFLIGLVLIPIGSWRYRKRLARSGAAARAADERLFPVYDLNLQTTRNHLVLLGVLTILNLTILAAVAYKGIEYMDSVSFCGQTCHPIMRPEFTAYQGSPHSRVRCVDCHIGPGAGWFVQSKLSGTKQVFVQMLGTWPRPIHTPIENLRPSRDTCEQCHWPEKFHGDLVRVRTHVQPDSANTRLSTVLLLKVGGGQPESGFEAGIHWHIANRVEYKSNEERTDIPWVRVVRTDGTETVYQRGESVPDSIAARPVRVMDCVDCHNRPTHIFLTPHRALDLAMTDGTLPEDLPYLYRESLAALSEEYPDAASAARAIESRLTGFYQESYPDIASARGGDIREAAGAVQAIWARNVFPELNITWGTYEEHIGHEQWPGCFRCHDEEHVAADGSTISQDCGTCHNLLAVEEQDPEVLNVLFP